MLETLGRKYGLAMAVVDEEGKIVLSAGTRNPLCEQIRVNEESLTYICSQTSAAMSRELKTTLQPLVETCEAGMLRIAVPIVKEGRLIGQVTGCGVAEDDQAIDPETLALQMGKTEETVAELARDVEARSQQEMWEAVGQAEAAVVQLMTSHVDAKETTG